MKTLIQIRNRLVLKRLVFLLIFVAILLVSQFPYLKESIMILNSMQAPRVYSHSDLTEALDTYGEARIDVNFLENTGFYYGIEEKNIVQYTYSYTSFGNQLLILAQSGDKDHQWNFEDSNKSFVVKREPGNKHSGGYDLIINEFSSLLNISSKQLKTEFYPEPLLLLSFRPHLQFSLYSTSLLITIFAYYIYRIYRKVIDDIETTLTPEALDILDEDLYQPILNSSNIRINQKTIIYKKTLSLNKQIIFQHDIAILGVEENRFYSIVSFFVHGNPKPIRLRLKNVEVFLIIEALTMNNVDYIRDDTNMWNTKWANNPDKDAILPE